MAVMEDTKSAEVEPLVNINELARGVGISTSKIYALTRTGSIPMYRCGRAVRFRLSEVLEWMRTKQTENE